MQNQYSRTQLLLGAEAMEKLHNSRVAAIPSRRWPAAVWGRWTSSMTIRSV